VSLVPLCRSRTPRSAERRSDSLIESYKNYFPLFHKLFHRDVENFGADTTNLHRTSVGNVYKSQSSQKNEAVWYPDGFGDLDEEEQLSCHFLQQFLIYVEVGVDVLHVVVIFERLDQPNHRRGLMAFELDVILRNHGHAG
jgi:hypothetical protein